MNALAYRRHADQDAAQPAARHPVVVVGAGPVGLALAVDLAQHGVPVVLLDSDDRLSTGSRAICFAKRTLEYFDRLGCGDAVVARGVSWNVGRVFLRDAPLYRFDLLPDSGDAPTQQRPAFVNLPQCDVEALLLARAAVLPEVDLRWKNTVVGIAGPTTMTTTTMTATGEAVDPAAGGSPEPGPVTLTVDTPDGPYALAARFVVACDGSRSSLRRLLGLDSSGRVFRDRFLIADVKMALDFPAERWFWFDPPFHPGQSVLLHRQPDNVWRIDFQLGWEADPEREKQPEHILPRVRALLAHTAMKDCAFALQWASVYTFACQRMASFRHGSVLFAGDAAHGVSPFGARGANSGLQDADNLAWKLAAVLQGRAPEALLDSYAHERERAADENIAASTRSTDFITPKSPVSRLFRDATLELAREFAFARALVNSGRLSLPSTYADSPLNTPDADGDGFAGAIALGAPAVDAPLRVAGAGDRVQWLLRALSAPGFHALVFFEDDAAADPALAQFDARCSSAARGISQLTVHRLPATGLAAERYDARAGTTCLLRPDQHVCARWRRPPTEAAVRAALRCALARGRQDETTVERRGLS